MKLLLLLLTILNLYALEIDSEEKYSFRFAYGHASENDLGQIVIGDLGKHPKDLTVAAFDGGYLLKKELFEWPVDIYVKGGLSYFNEDEFEDTMEMTFYFKAYLNLDFWENRVRVGAAEGVSYTFDKLETEYYEAQADNEPSSQFLNYLDLSIDFDFGRLIHYKPLRQTYMGYAIKHRSGVFGLYHGVHGGSNYNTLYIEKNF